MQGRDEFHILFFFRLNYQMSPHMKGHKEIPFFSSWLITSSPYRLGILLSALFGSLEHHSPTARVHLLLGKLVACPAPCNLRFSYSWSNHSLYQFSELSHFVIFSRNDSLSMLKNQIVLTEKILPKAKKKQCLWYCVCVSCWFLQLRI